MFYVHCPQTTKEESEMARNIWRKGDGLMTSVPVTNLQSELGNLINSFFETASPVGLTNVAGEWIPTMDVVETKDCLLVHLDLPGVDPSEISITAQGELLTIKGERKEEELSQDSSFHRIERRYGIFTRSFVLPATVNFELVKAESKNGVLTVTLPKREEARVRTIKVHTN